VTVAGERSKFFGPDGTYFFSGNGSTFSNLDADVYFRWVREQRTVERLIRTKPPLGPKRGVRRGVRGYVAGYNAYLRKVGRKAAGRRSSAGRSRASGCGSRGAERAGRPGGAIALRLPDADP
jgi:hypothetical protein